MVHDGQGQMRPPVTIHLRQQIAAPDPVVRHRSGNSVLQLPSGFIDEILVSSAQVRHVRLAHGHLSSPSPPPIEMMRDGSAPGLRHERFQSKDVIPYPLRLGVGAKAVQFWAE